MEFAWLCFMGGYWHFITIRSEDGIRKWVDKRKALADLSSEGWDVIGR